MLGEIKINIIALMLLAFTTRCRPMVRSAHLALSHIYASLHSVTRAVSPCRHERALGYPIDLGQLAGQNPRQVRGCGAGKSMASLLSLLLPF